MSVAALRRLEGGFSLIEVLVTGMISSLIVLAAFEFLSAASAVSAELEARQRLIERARLAFLFLGDEIRQAADFGCSGRIGPAQGNSAIARDLSMLEPWQGLQGWEAANTQYGSRVAAILPDAAVAATDTGWSSDGEQSDPPPLSADPLSDIIRLWRTEGEPLTLMERTRSELLVYPREQQDLVRGDLAVVNDCFAADLFQLCEVSGPRSAAGLAPAPDDYSILTVDDSCSPGNVESAARRPLSDYRVTARVRRLEGNLFYVGRRGNRSTNEPALYRRRLGKNGAFTASEELVEGVENMQILYGVDRASHDKAYLPASEVADFSSVTSVRVFLLIRDGVGARLGAITPTSYYGADYSEFNAERSAGQFRGGFTGTFVIRSRR